ncbi:MAG: restriction endonuclease subunit S [Anaerolineae bacterium]
MSVRTDNSVLPEGWSNRTIQELGHIYSGSTPSTEIGNYWDGDIVWITPNDLSKLRTRFVNSSSRQITVLGLKNSSARLLPPRSLVISSRAPIGYMALPTTEFCTNQGCKTIVFNSDQDADFHYYNLSFRVQTLREKGNGTTFAEISKTDLGQIEVPAPTNKNIQSAIASVLSTVDRAIEQTEALIAKYQRIKTGLMQDLLTRGIDEQGNLRDPATHKFKDSPLGGIPVEWELTTLGAVVEEAGGIIQTGPFGSQLHADEYIPEGVAFIMPRDIRDNGTLDLQGASKIPETRANDLKRHRIKPNDVIFGRRGDLSRCVAICSEDGICGSGCLLVRVPETHLDGRWLSLIYKHVWSQRQIGARAVGSTMVNLNTSLIASLLIAKPDIHEQRSIVRELDTVGKLYDLEAQSLHNLTKLKTGLMQDLLTGKVSVEPTANELRAKM